ncbi:hypothetical protein RN001_004093 [Aquatica leii]|uniref:Uncharacterized protein n=1 Tax=Aquatica leii TaxID=1421715 RepID=A0AAN7SL65_9COLE|nr:hypothetical protein RN001_004093 [Aquatica leii]
MKITHLQTGTYCHIGLTNSLEIFLANNPKFKKKELELLFNIDGLPLYKSSNSQLWHILCVVSNFDSTPFTVGVFSGKSKPKSLDQFLTFICDAPARAYVKRIKSHNGYCSCEKCIESGDYYDKRLIFKSISALKRTDESFRSKLDEDHNLLGKVSPLEQRNIQIVVNFRLIISMSV